MALSAIGANQASDFRRSDPSADDTEKPEKTPVSGTTAASADSPPAQSASESAQAVETEPARPVSDATIAEPSGDAAATGAAAGERLSALRDGPCGLQQELDRLSLAIEQLPKGKRRNEIVGQAAEALKLAAAAQKAGEDVQRIDRELANQSNVQSAPNSVALHKELNNCLATIHSAVRALDTLDKAVEGHCADFPGTGAAVRAAIATVVAALLALALMVVFPPLGVIAGGAVAIGGLVGVVGLIAEYSDRVDRRVDCWAAGKAASDHLAAMAQRAAKLTSRMEAPARS
ncbi:hypothetical protein [Cupriavidus sp. AU9028]|uniref:hypothetical protein n=1 Tax=Cupriavidus sp. AU9028 TaxID=2871157 RepID=UPI001C957EDB|nr:hypothetical protein [Cupriavidus sp. AU9028]MBY4895460.1 hypothetical protein [Cupriavidus sp. AU9028]